MNQYDPQKSDK